MQIIIADSQTAVRAALRMLLAQEPGVQVVGEAGDSQELLTGLENTRPDAVCLDWELPGQPIADVVSTLCAWNSRLRVIALCSRSEVETEALSAGAHMFVSKADPPSKLLTAVRVIQLENH